MYLLYSRAYTDRSESLIINFRTSDLVNNTLVDNVVEEDFELLAGVYAEDISSNNKLYAK